MTTPRTPAGATGFRFKKFQREDYARAALHDGIILAHDTGGGKGLALFVWTALKVGFAPSATSLQPLAPVLLVAPGDLHQQVRDEGREKFRAHVTALDSQETFLNLSTLNPQTGRRELLPGYYLTSYTQLSGNGVTPVPKFDRRNLAGLMELLCLTERDTEIFYGERGVRYQRHYQRLKATPEMTLRELERTWREQRKLFPGIDALERELDEAWDTLKMLAPRNGRGSGAFQLRELSEEQQTFVRNAMVERRYREYSASIGEAKYYQNGKIKCVHSPSLADLCQDAFAACAVDEGVKMKGEDTIVGQGVRQIASRYKLVLTATPIKNRLPDVFRLAWWAAGAQAKAHARFPYPDDAGARQEFAEEFLISERNLSQEEASESNRRYVKLTPQVCNVHRLWKILAPVILRRRKQDFGEDIVARHRHVVRVPMGQAQAAVYKFHLDAEYKDVNGMPAIGAQLQALRIAAANPASALLQRPQGDGKTRGEPRSRHQYTPKLHGALKLIQQVMERGEQVVVFSAFHDSLDALRARLQEAGVKHALLDGRTSQRKRGLIAGQFKLGPGQAPFDVLLAGVECMAEGHSFHLCNNVILMCYSWAYDKFEQAINRVHRLNSARDVNVYPIICEGSIDRKLEALIQEKGEAAELVLDGHLLGEHSTEVNLAELLNLAQKEFAGGRVPTLDERELEKQWPELRAQLAGNARIFRPAMAQPVKPTVLPAWRQNFVGRLAADNSAFSDLPLFAA